MSYRPTYRIKIGKYLFKHCQKLEILSDRRQLTSVCNITLPLHYKKETLDKHVNIGDAVEVYAGYDDNNELLFTGYVSQPQPGIPYLVMCEDEMWQLKRRFPNNKTMIKQPLNAIVKYLTGYDVKMPDVTPDKFIISRKNNVAWYLQKIKETYGFDVFFRAGELQVNFPYLALSGISTTPVKFNLQRNIIRHNLRYRSESDTLMRIKAISLLPDNSKLEVEIGDKEGELRTWHEYNVTKEQLQLIAEEKLKSFKNNSYSGQIVAFATPSIKHGEVAEVHDEWFNTTHTVFADSVMIVGGVQGLHQHINTGRIAG